MRSGDHSPVSLLENETLTQMTCRCFSFCARFVLGFGVFKNLTPESYLLKYPLTHNQGVTGPDVTPAV